MILRFLFFVVIIAFLVAIVLYWLYPKVKRVWYGYMDRVDQEDRRVEKEHKRRMR